MKRLLLLLCSASAVAAPDLVFKDASGRVLTKKDLEHATGTVRWEIVGAENVPPEAVRLHDEARAAGEKSDFARAHQLLERAHNLAPRWPYPVYDDAFTYVLEGRDAEAEKLYATLEKLAPRGFFTYPRELDCLRQQKRGALPPGFCRAYGMLDYEKPAQRDAILRGITTKFPAYASAWHELAKTIDDPTERLTLIERGLACKADSDTHGALLIDKALALRDSGKREEATRILGELALDEHTSLANVAMAKFVLGQIVAGR